ncbi:hypothetical protein N9015_01890 [Akkermansiaceae bacterium]|nr:hypothetical protein [Akkermansiaceae bacterium]
MRKLFAHLMAVLVLSRGSAFGQDLNDGLVAYYPFNSNANDESGNGNDGEALAGASLTLDQPPFTPSAPVQGRLQGPPAKTKFLAASLRW